jgi:undecaprenyl diphosphate synthase
LAYAELWFTDVYWPDFDNRHLDEALEAYRRRDRRFGGIKL